MNRLFRLIFLACVLQIPTLSAAERLRVAVASNFLTTLKPLAKQFQSDTGIEVAISSASTGKLTAQIEAGAPFDVFLSADMARPERLISKGLAKADSLSVYAIGQLVLVSRQTFQNPADILDSSLAIANPRTAPYGAAASQWLQQQSLQPRLLMGENINQTWHFFHSGAVSVAIVAKSQLLAAALTEVYFQDLEADPAILSQGMVILNENSRAASQFKTFLLSEQVQSIIESAGYLRGQPGH